MDKFNCKIALVAGEASGDFLGAELITQLKSECGSTKHLEFLGVGGKLMQAQGLKSLMEMEKFSLIGLVDILKRLPSLLWARQKLIKILLEAKIDIFIGIDAPELNLYIERQLKKHGVKTIHYVSPTIWAWRAKRIFKIAKSVNLMLTIYPFEAEIYQKQNIPVKFVGHPMLRKSAYTNPPNKKNARLDLDLPQQAKIIALLPGSRRSELKSLAKIFLKTAENLLNSNADIFFITAMSSEKNMQYFSKLVEQEFSRLPIKIYLNNSIEIISAADLVLCASGTVTLETMILQRPMVVAYKVNFINYLIAKSLIKIPYVSLPNIIAGEKLVPEHLQFSANPKELSSTIEIILTDEVYQKKIYKKFAQLKASLQIDDKNSLGKICQSFWE